MRILALVAVCCAIGTAHAGPRKLLVLRAESSTDWGTRTAVENAVLGLARNVDHGVGRTDTTFSEMAGVIGCTGDLDRCKGPVIDTLAVDEIVVITIAPAAGGDVKVTVRRAGKSGPAREASAVVAKADPNPALVASIGPLFGASRIAEPPRAADKPIAANPSSGGSVVEHEEQPPRDKHPPPEPPRAAAAEPKPPASRPARTAAAQPEVTAAPDNVVAGDRPRGERDRIYIGGMVAGGALAVVGLVLWQRAGSIEDDVQAAPDRTTADVDRLLDLEARGDRYAMWGNVTFLGGVALAGVSGYLFWRARRGSSAQARVTPVVLDRGGGIAFTWGTR